MAWRRRVASVRARAEAEEFYLHATSQFSRTKVDNVDHLYAKLPGGPLVLPTAAVVGAGDPNCTARERAQNPWACKRRLPEFTEFGPAKWVCPDG